MQVKRDAEENCPHHIRPATKSQQRQSKQNQRQPINAVQPYMKPVFHKIRGVMLHNRTVKLLRRTTAHPSDMCPPAAIARSVWITRRIRVRVVDAMRDNPVDWATFERECAAECQKVLHKSWSLITTMS